MTPLTRRKKISNYITAVLQEVRYRKLLNDLSPIEQMVSLFLFGETDVTRSENLTTTGLNDDEIDALEFFSWLEDRFNIVCRSETYF